MKDDDQTDSHSGTGSELVPAELDQRNGLLQRVRRFVTGGNREEMFDDFLGCLNEVEAHKEEQIRAELAVNYRKWADTFYFLKREFDAVWNVFDKIERDTTGWFRASPNCGQWGALGHCRDGYNFAAAVERNHRRAAPFPSKWVSVSFAYGDEAHRGFGDECPLGRSGDISDDLCGLEGCRDKTIVQQLQASRALLKTLGRHKITCGLYSEKIGQQFTTLDMNVLEEHSLADLCEKLFIALNNDELAEIVGELPFESPLLIGNA